MFSRDHHSDLDTIAVKAKQALKLNGIVLPEPRSRSPWNTSYHRLDMPLFELGLYSFHLVSWTYELDIRSL